MGENPEDSRARRRDLKAEEEDRTRSSMDRRWATFGGWVDADEAGGGFQRAKSRIFGGHHRSEQEIQFP
jgi:hypothetical protein